MAATAINRLAPPATAVAGAEATALGHLAETAPAKHTPAAFVTARLCRRNMF
jgi:hypothetical protein